MNCSEARAISSCYVDGAVTGVQMKAVSDHLAACGECRKDYELTSRTQQLVAGLGRIPAPSNLALKLQIALSQEASRNLRSRFQGFLVHLENASNAFMVPATAGFLSAVVFFGLLIGMFAVPASLSADDDIPLALYTPPQLADSPFRVSVGNSDDDSLVVDAFVDANGRIQDYRIISAPPGAENLLPQLDNMMIFTTFRPATSFGLPTAGRVVVSFANVNVRG
jgi:predicted anti-sigma-YlaC factor YlaD